MNILLWIVQAVLALLFIAGGGYKTFNTSELLTVPPNSAVPRGVWIALGIFEMACAILLIVPAAMKRGAILTPVAATALTVENVCLALVLYTGSSAMTFSAQNPLVWIVASAVLAAFVAVGRYAMAPL